ncbi:hypothetical protein O181_090240 [Austropuccinia psidii MF-1]|uniref:Uncharacterized protein n=1 Tax=Austropuccinia psidii MF-1 TaxID=1389203 RepID=A0A9Q3IVE8_9BASI|nr:hypothetical protein [Austropuccinia psidii MF-1]
MDFYDPTWFNNSPPGEKTSDVDSFKVSESDDYESKIGQDIYERNGNIWEDLKHEFHNLLYKDTVGLDNTIDMAHAQVTSKLVVRSSSFLSGGEWQTNW